MSELYAAGVDPYCYPGSSVLRNKFDIHDAQLLADVESLYTDHPVAGFSFAAPPMPTENCHSPSLPPPLLKLIKKDRPSIACRVD